MSGATIEGAAEIAKIYAPRCKWFLLCDKPAAGTVYHPVLGQVPTCISCAAKLDLDLRIGF